MAKESYPHFVAARLTDEQYNKVKDDISKHIRKAIDKYEA